MELQGVVSRVSFLAQKSLGIWFLFWAIHYRSDWDFKLSGKADCLTRDSLLTLTNRNRQFCMHKWLPAFFLLCSLTASTQTNNAIAITHVTVIDCTGAAAKPNSTVVVTSGLISAVGPSGTVRIPAGARVLDANGKFLIPGLWDMHGHLTDATADAFPLLIMNGVTGV